jgi:hypothetical protein
MPTRHHKTNTIPKLPSHPQRQPPQSSLPQHRTVPKSFSPSRTHGKAARQARKKKKLRCRATIFLNLKSGDRFPPAHAGSWADKHNFTSTELSSARKSYQLQLNLADQSGNSYFAVLEAFNRSSAHRRPIGSTETHLPSTPPCQVSSQPRADG